MAGVFIEVDTQQLQRDKNALQERLNQLRQTLQNVYGQMDELDAMWDGPANQAFKEQFASDRGEFEAVCAEVEALIASMEFARGAYEKCEAEVYAAVAAIRI